MTEDTVIKESEKLRGTKNFYIWSLKMKRNLRVESLRYITDEERKADSFTITLEGKNISEVIFNKRKALACQLIANSVNDDIVDFIKDHTDPAVI